MKVSYLLEKSQLEQLEITNWNFPQAERRWLQQLLRQSSLKVQDVLVSDKTIKHDVSTVVLCSSQSFMHPRSQSAP